MSPRSQARMEAQRQKEQGSLNSYIKEREQRSVPQRKQLMVGGSVKTSEGQALGRSGMDVKVKALDFGKGVGKKKVEESEEYEIEVEKNDKQSTPFSLRGLFQPKKALFNDRFPADGEPE